MWTDSQILKSTIKTLIRNIHQHSNTGYFGEGVFSSFSSFLVVTPGNMVPFILLLLLLLLSLLLMSLLLSLSRYIDYASIYWIFFSVITIFFLNSMSSLCTHTKLCACEIAILNFPRVQVDLNCVIVLTLLCSLGADKEQRVCYTFLFSV